MECKIATTTPGSSLSIDYVSYNGILDDYAPEANSVEGTLQLNLGEIVTNLSYPIATPVEGLIQDAGGSITALSENVITLLDVQRTATGFQFKWQNFQPNQIPA